jgi:glycosyltransferase involved in cell wall biosynthesis
MTWNTLAYLGEQFWVSLPLFLRRGILAWWCRRITAIKRTSEQPSILFLPLVSWYFAGFQRPQQMARSLAEMGCPTFYCEPITPSFADVRPKEKLRRAVGLTKLSDRLCLIRGPKIFVRDILRFCAFDAVVMSWPWQSKWFAPESSALLIYEMVDDHSLEGEDDGSSLLLHQWLVKEADLVVATADDLLAQLKSLRPDALLVRNGVRPEDWTLPDPPEVPLDMVEARKSQVVIGYVGAFASWFDWRLWEGLARARPTWAFVLIGYPADDSGRKIISEASKVPNIYYLGPKSQSELKTYLHHFDVATIPFVLNPITHACSPLKLFEYMACGKPIVATPMREIAKYQAVRFANDLNSFLNEIESALVTCDALEFKKALKDELRDNTWRDRAGYLLKMLKEVQQRQGRVPRRSSSQSASQFTAAWLDTRE